MVSFGSSNFIQSFMMILGASLMVMVMTMTSTVNALPVDGTLASNPDFCLGFRVTSPQQSGLRFTYGQCYEVSWDTGASTVKTVKVNLISKKTGKSVKTLAKDIAASRLSSGNFPLVMDTGAVEGNYYYAVVANDGKQSCTLNSATFYVMVNPNSPPSTSCPK
ncbi:hypothetical protein BJ944DRAFT_263636 [Cunninghamella echinulata]|nr:hypothetical protein BJ944DRAFT_263636 [Cunninghamella echinulata]